MAGDTLFVFILIGVASLLFASGRVRLDMVAPGVLLMVVAAVLGSVTSSTAVVAILIPVTLTLSREARLPASRLLLPMSFAALISGMMTLIGTTPNLVVAAELDREGYTPFGFFSFTPIGASVLLVAVVYMVVIGRRLLPSHVADDETGGRGVRELLASFEVEGRVRRLGVPEGSSLVGQSLAGARVATRFGGRVVLIERILPVAMALEQTGGVALVVNGLVSTFGSAGPWVMLTALFFLAAGLGLFLSNTATAVLVAPIAIEAARVMGVDPYVFAMTVAIAASAAFMTPVSTPVVTLVVEPGGYRFADFLKIGIPLVVLTWLVTLLVTPLVFGY